MCRSAKVDWNQTSQGVKFTNSNKVRPHLPCPQQSALAEPMARGSMQLSAPDTWRAAPSILTWAKLNGTQIIGLCQSNQRQHLKYSEFLQGLTGSGWGRQSCVVLILLSTKTSQLSVCSVTHCKVRGGVPPSPVSLFVQVFACSFSHSSQRVNALNSVQWVSLVKWNQECCNCY